MALTRVSRHIIDEPFNPTTVSATDVTATNINASGIGTVGTLRVTGDLTVEGTTTTLDSILTEVDRLEVSANSTVAAGIITQTGSGDILRLFDGASEVFSVADGGAVKIGGAGQLALDVSYDGSSATAAKIVTNTGITNANSTFTFAVNENSGAQMQLKGDGAVIFSEGSTERLRVTSTGYVGINENAPSNRLHVKETNSNTIVGQLESSVAYSYLSIEDSSTTTGNVRVGAHGNDLVMNAGALERLRITSDGKVRVPDNGKFTCGASDDLQIYHDGSRSVISDQGTGEILVRTSQFRVRNPGNTETYIKAVQNGEVELFYDDSKKFETSSTGISVTGQVNASTMHLTDGNGIHIGNSNDLRIYHDATDSFISHSGPGQLYIKTETDDRDVIIQSDNGSGGLANYVKCDGSTGAVELGHYGSLKLQTAAGGVNIVGNINLNSADSYEIRLGANNDLKLYHNGNHSIINNSTGDLRIESDRIELLNNASNKFYLTTTVDEEINLYYNNSKKFETTTTGAKVTGALEVTQEYPSIRPTLDLNFAATKTLDRRITFTRDSIGTYTDENGVLKYASNNTPRFDHDFRTGESLGLLIEESRTNLLSYSTSFNLWSSISLLSISVNNQTAPDGTQTAANFIFPTNPATIPYCTQSYTFSAVAHTFSIFAKYNGIQYLWLNVWDGAVSRRAIFDIQNGTLGSTQNSPSGQTITAYGNGWYRCTISATTSAGSGDISIRFANSSSDFDSDTITGNGSDGQYIWGAQLEQGSFATSYIPTSGSTVTRDDDDAVIKGTNFSDIYNETEGTIFSEFSTKVNTGSTSKWAVSLRDPANNNNYIAVKTYSANMQVLQVRSNGSAVADLSVNNSVVIDQFRRVAASFKLNDFDGADGGTLLTGDTSGAMPTGITQMDIGRGWTNSDQKLEGHIKSIKYYRTKLSNAQLQGLTQQ